MNGSCREGAFLIPRVSPNQKCKQDETPQVFYFTDAHSTTIFSWLEGSAYETSACNSVHALTLNACSTALQFCRTTIVQHTDRRKEIVQLLLSLCPTGLDQLTQGRMANFPAFIASKSFDLENHPIPQIK